MAHETVPADIAAAIEALVREARDEGYTIATATEAKQAQSERRTNSAYLALENLIIRRLGSAVDMKIALERIEQGV